jgi:hypothetical protein
VFLCRGMERYVQVFSVGGGVASVLEMRNVCGLPSRDVPCCRSDHAKRRVCRVWYLLRRKQFRTFRTAARLRGLCKISPWSGAGREAADKKQRAIAAVLNPPFAAVWA